MAKTYKRGTKEASKESEVKPAAAKAAAESADSVYSDGTSSADTATFTATSVFARAHNYTGSVVGVTRRSEYTLIKIIL